MERASYSRKHAGWLTFFMIAISFMTLCTQTHARSPNTLMHLHSAHAHTLGTDLRALPYARLASRERMQQ